MTEVPCEYHELTECGNPADYWVLERGSPGPVVMRFLCRDCIVEWDDVIMLIGTSVDVRRIPPEWRPHRFNSWYEKIDWDEVEHPLDDCYPWDAYCTPIKDGGHGQFWNGERMVAQHRWIYEVYWGIPAPANDTKWEILHYCGTAACGNPHHLYWGTHAQNAQHAYDQGNGNRFPDHVAIDWIRRHRTEDVSCQDLADEHPTASKSGVWGVVKGKSECYSHLHEQVSDELSCE